MKRHLGYNKEGRPEQLLRNRTKEDLLMEPLLAGLEALICMTRMIKLSRSLLWKFTTGMMAQIIVITLLMNHLMVRIFLFKEELFRY